MKRPHRPRPTSIIGKLIAFLLAFAFVGVIGSCIITIAIWPGEIKLLAPIFCTDAQPDPFVVADTYSPQPGETVTNFTLYCMGPRGDSTDHGFLRPFLMISVVNGVVIMGGLTLLGVIIGRTATRGDRNRVKIPPIPTGHAPGDGSVTSSGFDESVGAVPYPVSDPHGLVSDPSDEPRRPNQAPPGSTPGPFVD